MSGTEVALTATITGVAGWYVPTDAIWCPRCGDQNWDEQRLCITCTDGDSAYCDGAFENGWSARRT